MINESDAIPDPLPAGGTGVTPPSEAPSIRGSAAFAIFLCCIGIALAVIVVGRLGVGIASSRPGEAATLSATGFWPLLWFFSFVGAIAFLFVGINPESEAREADSPLGRVMAGIYRIAASVVGLIYGLVLLALSLVALLQIVDLTEAPTPNSERFALVYEPAGPDRQQVSGKAAQQPAVERPGYASLPPGTRDDGARAEQPGRAVLLWSVPGKPSKPQEGMLAMFLGCILVIIFGLFYPRMSLNTSSDTATFIQKLVVPLISLGLFGVGVQQQAHAEQLNEDVELAKRGMPPVMFLAPDERLRVLNRDYLQPTTVNYLSEQLASQQQAIYLQPGETNPEIARIMQALAEIRAELKRPNTTTTNTFKTDSELLAKLVASTDANTSAIRDTATALGNTTAAVAGLKQQQVEQFCETLYAKVQDDKSAATNLYRVSALADEKRKRDIFRLVWLALKGEDKDRVDRERAAQIPPEKQDPKFDAALEKLAEACPQETASR